MTVSRETAAELARQRAEINRILNARQIAAAAAWEASWGRIQDELTSWADAWAEIAEAASDPRASRNMYRLTNLKTMWQLVEDELRGDLDLAMRYNRDSLGRLVLSAGQHSGRLAHAQMPIRARGAIAWQTTDPAVLEAIVQRATEQITARHYYLSVEATKSVRSSLRLSAAAGDNPRMAARDMIARTQGVFNGGLARAEVIARTELLDGYRQAAYQSQWANRDILTGWVWLTELSSRTCPACLDMNGSEHPLTEEGPIDHQCGRCSRVPLIKPLSELGIGGPEPLSVVPDSEAWFNAQPAEVQRQIMGPTRLQAYQEGRFPRERWSKVVHTDGWRDSVHVGSPLD